MSIFSDISVSDFFLLTNICNLIYLTEVNLHITYNMEC